MYKNYKRTFVILLLAFSLLFMGLLLFSKHLVSELQVEEKNKVSLWVGTVQKRAQLMEDIQAVFEQLDSMENERAHLFAMAYRRIIDLPGHVDLTFYEQFINSNKSIPYILADEEGHINATRNISDAYMETINTPEKLKKALKDEQYETIPISYLPGQYIYLHYKESNLSVRLRKLFVENFESFTNDVIQNAPSVPVIVTDTTRSEVFTFGNVDSSLIRNPEKLSLTLADMERKITPFRIKYGSNQALVFYEDSLVLRMTRIFPYILGASILVFFIILIIGLLYNQHLEHNYLWAGLTKETAHQLGTPLSALMAWAELLKNEQVNPEIVNEIEKDIGRLNIISRRFSNIESQPEMQHTDIVETIRNFMDYFRHRISSKINIEVLAETEPLYTFINVNLFEWVLENLGRNAVDAMEGEGDIRIICGKERRQIYIDFKDNGKGISRKNMRKIFQPGFTTKKRGWGVGMTLCQRIIQSYHHGSIEVRQTELGKGTTFRITLPEKAPRLRKK